MNKITIVVEHGIVQNVYSLYPNQTEIELIDLDMDGSDPETEAIARKRLNAICRELHKIY